MVEVVNGVNIINEYDRANRVTKRCYTKPNVNTTATTCAQIPSGDQSTEATESSSLLRAGRSGENSFTSTASLDAKRAQIRLGLDGRCRITASHSKF